MSLIGGVLLATLLSAAMAQTTTRVHIGNVLPTSATLTTAMSNAVTAAKPQFAHLNGSNIEFLLTGVNASILPISDNVRILLADSQDSNIDVIESTSNRVTIAINTRSNTLLDKRSRPHLFRMVPDESTEATLLVDLAQRFNQSRVVVVYENSQFGTANLGTARTRLAAQMITNVREIEIASNADAAATRTALLPAQAATVGSDGKPTNVGTFLYLGNNVTVLERVFTAAASLNITGSPYLWLVASAAQSLTPLAAQRPEFRGIVSLSHFANETQLAYDAVLAAASALDSSYLSLDNADLIAQALSAVRFQGQSGAVAFAASTQDRPAQYNIDNVQAGVRVNVGSFSAGAFTLNATAVLFSTGERGTPVYPFVSCASLHSCADCTVLAKCQWCGQTSTCSLVSAGAGVCSGQTLTNPGFCPAECVASSAPGFCLYPANLTIWSTQKPRCDALNKPLVPPAFLAPEQPNNCTAALARERPCQQLLQRISCSASCQQCTSNSTAQALPVCQSVCDPLINAACPLTKAACTQDGSPFAFLCGPDSAPCSRTVIDAQALIEPPVTTTTTTVATTTTATTAPVTTTTTPVTTTTGSDSTAPTTTGEPTTTTATESGDTTATTTEPVATEPTAPTSESTTAVETTSSTAGATPAPQTSGNGESTSSTGAATATTTTVAGGSTTTDAAAYASVLAAIKKNTTELYEAENHLRIGIGVGLTAFVCCIILLVACLLSRK